MLAGGFFRGLAREFQCDSPSAGGDLTGCGAAFLAASLAGDLPGDAVTAALHRQPDVDLGQALTRALSAR